jgi:hypothetical protein
MKTAMQELIDYIESNVILYNKDLILKLKELLEKEKEQIIDAANSVYEDKTTWGERYYKQKYGE